MHSSLLVASVGLLLAAVTASQRYPSGLPVNTVLSAPWTPFLGPPSYALNTKVIPQYAANIAASGVNVVWIAGGMGQFDLLSMDERKQLAEAWVPEAKKNGLFCIIHVGTTVQSDAIELATHAAALGADAISSVPPYYEHFGVNGLVDWFVPIVNASGNLPFLYYHIPGSTGENIEMAAFVPAVLAKIPSFAGVKFVDNDAGDFFSVVGTYGDRIGMLWAPEPKLQGILLGARGVILAESFYAPTWLRMCTEISSGNWTAAHLEQQWKFTVDAIFGNYGGTNAKRALYNYTAKIDIGPNRPPQGVPLTPSQYQGLIRDLTAAGFFAQNIPGPCLLPKSW